MSKKTGGALNSALLRLAAVYHRALKAVADQDLHLGQLVPRAKTQGIVKESEIAALRVVNDNVNDLKHTVTGLLGVKSKRTDFTQAIQAVQESVDLLRRMSAP